MQFQDHFDDPFYPSAGAAASSEVYYHQQFLYEVLPEPLQEPECEQQLQPEPLEIKTCHKYSLHVYLQEAQAEEVQDQCQEISVSRVRVTFADIPSSLYQEGTDQERGHPSHQKRGH
ncbi:hypothetical protein FGO68_gene8616 [Halteria grandinella]|uniref:Uncharacterized protein n=1 Tax=Halteria grandinella TaxID=5974 RepID=A0A8J8P5G8_HALGN|nr:hypothetical protein FGO68_gene8616 [Halteria grandinella]